MTYTGLNIMQIILYQSILRAITKWSMRSSLKQSRWPPKSVVMVTLLVTSPSEVVLSLRHPPHPTSSFSLLCSAFGMRQNTLKSSLYFNTKLKKLRRHHQRQKPIGFMSKTTRFLVHFFHVHCTTTTWNLLMRRFMEDVNIRGRIFLSLFEVG